MQLISAISLITALGLSLTPFQTTREYVQGLVGRRLILRHVAGSAAPKVKEKELGDTKGTCDQAVELTAVNFDKSAIRLQLRNIGTPVVGGRHTSCSRADVYSLEILDFDIDQPVGQAEKALGYVLQTPEAFLESLGVPWTPGPSSQNVTPMDITRPGLTLPRILLSVNPYYPATSRRDRTEGTVTVQCVMGTDGLVHDPVIIRGLSDDLNKLALEAVSFYRVQPARDGDHPVSVKGALQFSFKLH
jgi:TonB family protein